MVHWNRSYYISSKSHIILHLSAPSYWADGFGANYLFFTNCPSCRALLISDMIIIIILGKEYKLQSSSVGNFLQSLVTSSLLGPYILLSALSKNTPNVWRVLSSRTWRFGGAYCLHLQGRSVSQPTRSEWLCFRSNVLPPSSGSKNELSNQQELSQTSNQHESMSSAFGGTYCLHLHIRRVSQTSK
jgi:hypothetical protein